MSFQVSTPKFNAFGGIAPQSGKFIDLSDTPSALTAGKYFKVNDAGTAIELVDAPTGGGSTYTPPFTNITNLTSNTITLTQTQLDDHINGVFYYKVVSGTNYIPHAVPVKALENNLTLMRVTGTRRVNWVASTRTLTITNADSAVQTAERFAYAVLIG